MNQTMALLMDAGLLGQASVIAIGCIVAGALLTELYHRMRNGDRHEDEQDVVAVESRRRTASDFPGQHHRRSSDGPLPRTVQPTDAKHWP